MILFTLSWIGEHIPCDQKIQDLQFQPHMLAQDCTHARSIIFDVHQDLVHGIVCFCRPEENVRVENTVFNRVSTLSIISVAWCMQGSAGHHLCISSGRANS